MKEIELYAVYNADDGRELLGYFDTLLAAKTHPFNKLNCFVVKLTGMMPEQKKFKKKILTEFVYIYKYDVLPKTGWAETKSDIENFCRNNGCTLLRWNLRTEEVGFEVEDV